MYKSIKSTPIGEFSRFADDYSSYNIIQRKVAAKLVSFLEEKYYESIIDIGCGSGQIYSQLLDQDIGVDRYCAMDASTQMLELHPSESFIKKQYLDFNDSQSFHSTLENSYSLLLSSSALQWSKDLDMTLSYISKMASEQYLAIFTSNTFKTLHTCVGIKSPIVTSEEIYSSIKRYFIADFEMVKYSLEFETNRDMFRYIKKSGVSGGDRKLSYTQTRKIIEKYPLDYLEFEVLFVKAKSRAFTN